MRFNKILTYILLFILIINVGLGGYLLYNKFFKKATLPPEQQTQQPFNKNLYQIQQIKSINSGDDRDEYVFTGNISKAAYIQNGKVYIEINPENINNPILKIFVGKPSYRISTNTPGDPLSAYKFKSIDSIYSLLTQNTKVELTVITRVKSDIVKSNTCDDYCKELVELINSNNITKTIQSLINDNYKNVHPIGPIVQISFK